MAGSGFENDSGRYSPLPFEFVLVDFEDLPACNDEETKIMLQQAVRVFLTLHQSYEPVDLKEVLVRIKTLLKNDIVRKYLEENQIHLSVLGTLKHLATHCDIQKICCELFSEFLEYNIVTMESIAHCDILKYVIHGLYDNIFDADMLKNGMKIFARVLSSAAVRDQLLLDGQLEKILDLLTIAVTAYREVTDIQIHLFISLQNLLMDDVELQEIFINKQLVFSVEVLLANKSKPNVVREILKLYEILTKKRHGFVQNLIEEHIHLHVLDLIRSFKDDESLIEVAFRLLTLLNKQDRVQKTIVLSGFASDTLFPLMLKLPYNDDLQYSGLKILYTLAHILILESNDITCEWVHVIYVGMCKHRDKKHVQVAGCKALYRLLQLKPDASHWIGEDLMLQKQDPVHNLCLGALLMYIHDRQIFVHACEALFWLSADNERLCTLFRNKNAYIAVTEGLKIHMSDAKAVETACRALRGLCIFHDDNKHAVSMDGVLSLLTSVLIRFPQEELVQIEAISVIACLADVDNVRHQCFVDHVHDIVMATLRAFPSNVLLQEVGLEALAVLAGAANGAEMLISLGALFIISTAMSNFQDIICIQKKALIVLQLLANDCASDGPDLCRELAKLTICAMSKYPDDVGIQLECCVAVQLMAESSGMMSELFVEFGCHELLFLILENFTEKKGLQDLASECLCVLTLEQNLKSSMLLSACSRCVLSGVECLIEMGADVNIGCKDDTPLCHSVRNKDEEVVQLLLKQGVTDLQMPLKLSLEIGNDYITGLLLDVIGHDREGGSISWTGLNLSELEPVWFMVSLSNLRAHEFSTDKGKHIVSKIHESQQKRHIRLHHSNSDSEILQTHRQFRFRCYSDTHKRIGQENSRGSLGDKGRVKVVTKSSDYHKKIVAALIGDDRGRKYNPEKTKTNLPTITGTPNSENSHEDLSPFFDQSPSEVNDWKGMTLTGANIPVSNKDPRWHYETGQRLPVKADGPWMRKWSPHSRRLASSRFSASLSPMQSLDNFNVCHKRHLLSSIHSANYYSIIGRHRSPRRHSVESILSDFDSSRSSVNEEEIVHCIDVSSNNITSLDKLCEADVSLLNMFIHVEKLFLAKNKLKELPDSLFQYLPNLHQFDVKMNQLKALPSTVFSSKYLQFLDVSENTIHTIGCIQMNYCLKELNLSFNNLEVFPEELINSLPNLEKLQLSRNNLKCLPDCDVGLEELKILELSHNNISQIPEDFLKSCFKLETLEIAKNKLETLPSENVAKLLVKMNKIVLRQNKISEKEPFFIPKFILQLPSIKSVDLCDNDLRGLPSPLMWRTQILKELLFSGNHIHRLNLDGVKRWIKLESLNLANTGLVELPKEIGQLTNLMSLNISYNKDLTSLPDELGRCSKMWELGLEGLDLDLPQSMVRGRVRDLIIYLHHRLKKAKCHYRLKLMVVGYGGKGKSTLLRALQKRYRSREQETPTVGVIVEDWRFDRLRKDLGRHVTYTLSTWDFAGQEEFYSTHQCFLSNRSLYLAVYDVSEGVKDLDALKPWLSNIQVRAPGCPVIVVGTHLDTVHKDARENLMDEITNKLHELTSKPGEYLLHELTCKPGFPMINDTLVVDCTCENSGIEQLRASIKNVIDNFSIRGLPVMGQKIPASYVKLTELLSEEAKNLHRTSCVPIISHKQLVRIVQNSQLDLDENKELEQAVRFLHESGMLLHYEDTTLQLKDLYFIDPGWLCRMMAQIVTVKEINPFINQYGILKKEHVELLFTGKTVDGDARFYYPPNLIPQYLKLLEKFEIALPHTADELLIPCRLSEIMPDLNLPHLSKREKICRHYCMPYAPIGMLARLITRLITYCNSTITELQMVAEGPVKLKYWRNGICAHWSDTVFFLLESISEENEELRIVAPATTQGAMLLGQIVDHVDALIEEWYPGLTTIYPSLGRELLEKMIPCPFCLDGDTYMFSVDDILKTTEHSDEVTCPNHGENVLLSVLAPDLVMSDLEAHFQLDREDFHLSESADCLLGDGGFGSVYSAMYADQAVAVKVFTAIGDIHPHKMLRQEVTILRVLKHPNVVSMLAVGLRPRVIVMELAPCGSLGAILKNGNLLNKVIQHRIASQIADGLAYLHRLLIMYRDMKPDNILIFSLSPSASVNAKISDYGIARFSTLYGLMAQEGTHAYRAPEVIRGETYSFQADVFSLGITLYVMLTRGRHPFDEFEYKNEMDRAIAEGLPIPPITQKGGSVWPDVQDVISSCVHQMPDCRPQSVEVKERLHSSELYCLQRVIRVSISTTVECVAIQEQFGDQLQLWVASGDTEYMQLSWLNLYDYNMEVKGAMFREGRILCLQPIGSGFLLVGTQTGQIWVYDTLMYEPRHSTCLLLDAVLCILLVSGRSDNAQILAGLANGMIAVFSVTDILNIRNLDPIYLKPGLMSEPIKCMVSKDNYVFASCGSKIVIINTISGIAIVKILETLSIGGQHQSVIYTMAANAFSVYCSRKRSSVLEVWDPDRGNMRDSVNLSEVFQIEGNDSRITALSLQENKALWVGTGGGHIALLHPQSLELVVMTCRHTSSVRCLVPVREKGTIKFSGVLSGGLGFKERPGATVDREDQCGSVAVWAWDFVDKAKAFRGAEKILRPVCQKQ